MSITITQLRADLFTYLDQVLATGEPLIIERKGRVLKVIAEPAAVPVGSRLSRLVRRPTIIGDPDALVEPTPSEWSGGTELARG